MSQYDNLKAAIAANVYENHNNQVTANMVKAAMNAMTDSLGAGYQYLGIATPATTPGTPDQKVFYIAPPGEYPNFGTGISVAEGEVAILKWDTAWHKEVTGAATAAQVTELGQKAGEIVGITTKTTDYTLANYGLTLSGNFGTISSTKHAILPVSEGDVYILRSDVDSCRYAFATSAEYSAGSAIPLVSGTSVVAMSQVGSPYKVSIPSGCTHLLFNAGEPFNSECFVYFETREDALEGITDEVPTLGSNNLVKSGGVASQLGALSFQTEKLEQVESESIPVGDDEERVLLNTKSGEIILDVDLSETGAEEIIEVNDKFGNKCLGITQDGLQVRHLQYLDGTDYYKNPHFLRYGLDEMMVQWTTPFAIQTKHTFRSLLIWGWTDTSGNFGVSSYNERTGEIKRTIIGATASRDMHNSPAVFELADGRIGVITCKGHNNYDKVWVYISTNVGDISVFDPAIEVSGWAGSTTYSQIHYIGGVYYVFVRTYSVDNGWRWQMMTSTDFETWSTPKSIVLANTTQYYVIFKEVEGSANILRMVMYSNPDYPNMNIRLGYLDVRTGDIYNNSIDAGNIIGTWDNPPTFADFTTIIANPSGKWQRLFDVAVTDIDSVSIAFSRWTTAYDSEYFVYQNGTITKICDGGEAYLHARAQLGARLIDGSTIAVARNDVPIAADYAELYHIADGQPIMISRIDSVSNGSNHLRINMPMLDKDLQYLFYAKGTFDTSDYTQFDSDIMFVKLFN